MKIGWSLTHDKKFAERSDVNFLSYIRLYPIFSQYKINSHHIVSLNYITYIIFNTCCAVTCNRLLIVSWFFIVFSRDMPASARHLGYFLSYIRRYPIFTHHPLFSHHIVSLNFVTFVNYIICCPGVCHSLQIVS